MLAYLNINSTTNKFDLLASQVIGNVDILAICETNLDASFPIANLKYWISRLFLRKTETNIVERREDIPAKHLSRESTPIESFSI